jgi:hypothetical protein
MKVLFFLLVVAIATITGCASTKKSSGFTRQKQASHVNASQLGRNKFYFSTGYQKKLAKSYKK